MSDKLDSFKSKLDIASYSMGDLRNETNNNSSNKKQNQSYNSRSRNNNNNEYDDYLRSRDSGYNTAELYDSQEHSLDVENDSRPLRAENLARSIEE